MKQLSKKQWMLLAVAVNALSLAVCVLCLNPMPRNNDDAIVHMVTSGVYGSACAKLGSVNVLFGQLLVLLGRLVPALNWVSVIEIVAVFLCFSALSAVAIERQPNRLGLVLVLIGALVFAPRFYLNLHYTRSVILIAAAGFYLFFAGVETRRRGLLWLGAALACLASIIRFGAFLSGAAFAAVIGFLMLFSGERVDTVKAFWAQNKRLILSTVVLFAVIFGMLGYDVVMVATDDELAAARQYNTARRVLADYELPSYDENREAYAALGISRNDWDVIAMWGHGDLEIYPTETLQAIAALRAERSIRETVGETISLMTSSRDYRNLYVLAALVVPLVLLFVTKGLWRAGTAAMPLLLIALGFLLGFAGRTTPWVTEGNAAAAFLGAVFCLRGDAVRPLSRKTMTVIAVGPAVLLFAGAGSVFYQHMTGPGLDGVPQAALAHYQSIANDEDNLYLQDVSVIYSYDRIVPPLRAIPKGLFSNLYFLGGWDTGSPARNAVLERYGVTSPYRALVERDDVYLIQHYPGSFDMKLALVREHITPFARYAVVTAPCGTQAYTFTDGSVVREGDTKGLPEAFGGISIDPARDSMYQINIALGIEAAKGSVAYVALYEDGDEKTTLQYRVPVEDSLITFSFPVMDLPVIPETLEAVVYLESDGESVCSDRLALHYE